MADKTQNININYKFNTAEIEKAQQSLNRANEASNKLQQNAAKGFGEGAKNVNNYGKSIAGLENQLAVLANRVKLAANPADLAKWSGEWRKVKTELDAATKSAFGFGKATTESSKGMQSLVLGFKELSRFAGAAVIAGVTKQIIDLTLNMATLQGQVEGVERGFNRAFANPGAILEQVREATHGTITDFELMKRTLQATNLGVSVEHLGKLFEFAAVRAQQTGESVDYLVDSIVRGIGRKSPLVLDNLGISVTALKEKFDGASLASQSVADATKGVAEIAEEQLKKMGGFVETAETRVKALQVAWENVRISFAKKIDSTGFINFLKQSADALNALIKGQKTLQDEEAKNAATKRLSAVMDDEIFKDKKKNQLAQLDILMQELITTKELIRVREQELNQFKQAQAKNPISVSAVPSLTVTNEQIMRTQAIEGLQKQIATYEALVPAIANAIRVLQSELALEGFHVETLDEMRERLKKLTEEFGNIAKTDIGGFEKKAEEIKTLRHEIEKIEALLKDPKAGKYKIKVEADPGDISTEILKKTRLSVNSLANKNMGALFMNPIPLPFMPDLQLPDFWKRIKMAIERDTSDKSDVQAELNDAIIGLELGAIDILGDQLMSIADVEAQSFDRRIRAARQFYEENMNLAGDNEKAKDRLRIMEDRKIAELRKKQFIAEQKAMKQKAIINGAAAITKTFAEFGFTPAAIVAVALLAAQTASQIAIIDRQQPRFKEGVIDLKGPGTATSDSIPAWLSRGESVMTAWETKNSGGILKDIRAKKLNDKVLRDLKIGRMPVPALDSSGIIKAIKENRPPDVVEQSGVVYKGIRKSEDYISKVRAKSVRI